MKHLRLLMAVEQVGLLGLSLSAQEKEQVAKPALQPAPGVHKEAPTVTLKTNTPGATYFQSGPIGGDLGGIYNIHFESAPFMAGGKSVRFRSSLRLLSPLNYRVAMSLSVNDGPFTNMGNPWWKKDLSYVSK